MVPHLLPEGASATLAFVDRHGAGRCLSSSGTVIWHFFTKGITPRSRDETPAGARLGRVPVAEEWVTSC